MMEIEINSIKTPNVCIPVINLEPLVEKGSRWNAAKRNADVIKDSQSKEAVIAGLKDAYIDISGVIGDAVLSLKDIVNLQVGDVIKLRQTVDSDMKLYERQAAVYGIPGIIRNRKHIRITNVLRNN